MAVHADDLVADWDLELLPYFFLVLVQVLPANIDPALGGVDDHLDDAIVLIDGHEINLCDGLSLLEVQLLTRVIAKS